MHVLVFFKILIFWVARGGGKVQKAVQNGKKVMSVALVISEIIHHMIVIYVTHV